MRLIIVLISFVIIGCSPSSRLDRLERRHPELFKTTIDTVIKVDTLLVKDSVVINDSIKIKVASDTVKVDTVIYRFKKLSFDPIYAHSDDNIAHAKAYMNNGNFKLEAWATYDTLYYFQKQVKFLRTEIREIRTISKEQKAVIKEKNSLLGTIKLISIIALIIIVIFFIIKIFK